MKNEEGRVKKALLVAAAIALASGAMRAQAPPSPQAPATAAQEGDAENGRRLYIDYACYYCHGTEGQGGLATVGPRVALVPRSLESFTKYVRQPTGRMSAYSEQVLSNTDLADIYAYLRAQAPARPSKDVPLLDALRKPGGR